MPKDQIVFVATMVQVAAVAISSWRSLARLIDDADGVTHTHKVLEHLDRVALLASDAQRSERGFVITGDESFLEPYHAAAADITLEIGRVAQLTADNREQQERIRQVATATNALFVALDRIITERRRSLTAGIEAMQRNEGRLRLDDLNRIIEEMRQEEIRLLASRDAQARTSAGIARVVLAAGNIVAGLLALLLILGVRQRLRERATSEAAAVATSATLNQNLLELQLRSERLRLLSDLGEYLQNVRNNNEFGAVLSRLLPQLFPATEGSVHATTPSRNVLESLASWPPDSTLTPIPTGECWALTRGTPHISDGRNPACAHLAAREGVFLCVPMMAQGETVGLLLLNRLDAGEMDEAVLRLARTASEQIGLALANVELKATLRRQAIRDPLTGLFNRRYMEESIERELHRATRRKAPLGLMLLDLDHFKEFNDSFGHGAGDALLRNFGDLLLRNTRTEDIACRYGGDEFLLILPDSDLQSTSTKGQELLSLMRAMTVPGFRTAPGLTASIGVAAFPGSGEDMDSLINAADASLYKAKEAGRNQVA